MGHTHTHTHTKARILLHMYAKTHRRGQTLLKLCFTFVFKSRAVCCSVSGFAVSVWKAKQICNYKAETATTTTAHTHTHSFTLSLFVPQSALHQDQLQRLRMTRLFLGVCVFCVCCLPLPFAAVSSRLSATNVSSSKYLDSEIRVPSGADTLSAVGVGDEPS